MEMFWCTASSLAVRKEKLVASRRVASLGRCGCHAAVTPAPALLLPILSDIDVGNMCQALANTNLSRTTTRSNTKSRTTKSMG